jgi:hypothetical protein
MYMKKLHLLTLILSFLTFMLTGCSHVYDLGTPEQKALKASKTFFVIRSDDGQVGITVEAKTNDTFDGVTIEPARNLTAAIYKEVSLLSSRFSAPDELPRETSEMVRSLPSTFLGLSLYTKGATDYAISVPSLDLLKGKKLNEHPYSKMTKLDFNCAGVTEQVCTQRITDSFVQAVTPMIKMFLTEQGY